MPNLANLPVADLQAGTANWSGQGYIDGLKMVWNSATSISVTSGAAFIPALSKCLPSLTTLTLSGLVLTASTWYHVYLYSNAGVPAIECVTTAPAAAYVGTARAKTGDTSRRYIGSVKTDASGNVYNFLHQGDEVRWLAGVSANFRAISNGQATTITSVSLSNMIPATSRMAAIRAANTASNTYVTLANSSFTAAAANGLIDVNQAGDIHALLATDASQSIQYILGATPTGGGLFLDVEGYLFDR